MSEAAHIQFDDPPRGAEPEGAPATERIAATLKSAGIDAPNALYDEALLFARDGHLGQSQARLQMLLCLDPDDADALLLMAKVNLAQGKPADALARLDAAVAAGGLPPAGFREQLETAIRAERAREEEHRARIAAREQGEIRSLRNETRTLRSEQVRLETEITETRIRERNWKYAALGTSVLATVVILLLLATGGRDDAPTVAAEAPPAAPPAAAGVQRPLETDVRPPRAELSDAEKRTALEALAAPPAATEMAAPKAAAAAPVAKEPAAPVAKEPAAKAGGKVHVVASGDTLEKLAVRYYGDKTRWEEIQAANKRVLKGGIALSIGMELKIP